MWASQASSPRPPATPLFLGDSHFLFSVLYFSKLLVPGELELLPLCLAALLLCLGCFCLLFPQLTPPLPPGLGLNVASSRESSRTHHMLALCPCVCCVYVCGGEIGRL